MQSYMPPSGVHPASLDSLLCSLAFSNTSICTYAGDISLHVPATFTRTSSNFWTSVSLVTLSAFPSLICGFFPSGQRFAYSFFQIPSHGGHPCRSAMCFVVAYAHSGLSPVRTRPCWANKRAGYIFLYTLLCKECHYLCLH